MRYLFAGAVGVIGVAWCLLNVAVAAPADQKSEKDGIVNERSTGNEPFMGPGASGGRSHSAPGATENTIKQQPSGMKQGGHRSESSGQLSDGRPSESNPVTRQQLERNAEQGGGAAVAAEVLKEEGSKKHDSH